MAALFYAPAIAQQAFLPEEEARHCLQVLRYQKGDTILVVDGKGYFWEALITNAQVKHCSLEIKKQSFDEAHLRDYYLHLAIAPTKNIDRMEWLVEKCTEIGIDEISFLQCQRSERKEVKIERLEKVAIQAMKQSQKAFLPKINGIAKFKDFLIEQKDYESKLIGYVPSDTESKNFLHFLQKSKKVCMLVGPEGDFTEQEIQEAQLQGFEVVSLGKSVLRTETAGLAVCFAMAHKI